MGRRKHFIGRALAALACRLPIVSMRTSEIFHSAPQGYDSDGEYINIAAVLTFTRQAPWTEAEALALLDAIKAIEADISDVPHRNADGSYRDREIDIDIIAIDDRHIDTPRLTVPHPRMHTRPFVTIPLAELGYPR